MRQLDVREIADNSNTPPETLTQLVKEGSMWGRVAVARNPSTPPEALAKLAEDKQPYVRAAIAEHPNTPPEVLTKLAEDRWKIVSEGVNQHPTYLQYRAEKDGICEAGQQMPVEWLKQMYLAPKN